MNETREQLRQLLSELSYFEGDFTLTSGRKSAYLVDVKRTVLSPHGAQLIGKVMLAHLRDSWPKAVAVGGRTLGADPLAVCMSYCSVTDGNRPIDAFIVRKSAKGHGSGNLVEASGRLKKGSPVVVLEDVVTTGGSALAAVKEVREAGFEVCGVLALVDRVEGGEQRLAQHGLALETVFSANQLKPNAT